MDSATLSTIDPELKKNLIKTANTIRHLSMDGVQKANSGHPGLPLGCAELGAYLYGEFLKYNPQQPDWMNRDRFILSAGHGSMFLYSCLHLAGYELSIDDLKSFRQLGSKTPGHPENFLTPGVETTTGPLGQGFANAVGQALGLKLLASRFNTEEHEIINNKVVVLAGDGDFMEGISSEASSFAGHLNLNNLIVIYDYNLISLDGPLSESCSEDTKMRYKAYGWDVKEINGHNFAEIHESLRECRQEQKAPLLIIAKTTIGKGSPNKAGTHKVHGAPLGEEEVALSKKFLELPDEDFFVPQAVRNYFSHKASEGQSIEEKWNSLFEAWSETNPEKRKEFDFMKAKALPENLEELLRDLEMAEKLPGRTASQNVLNLLAEQLPQLYGGSADLSCSDMTMMKDFDVITPCNYSGRNIKYGVREFAMGAISTGLAHTGMILPFCGTFLVFSDYLRNAIRLAALMKEQVVYQFTHDSIFLGEDGPTHQPVEHLAALRAMPNLQLIRPADNNEVKMAWLAALRYQGPTALALSRQKLPLLEGTDRPYSEGVGRGAYILKQEKATPDFTLIASGSELSLAVDLSTELEKLDKHVRIISMPCWELFEQQSEKYKNEILGGNIGKRVSIEAATEQGWHKYIGREGIAICQEGFGGSAPAGALAKEFGFTVESILERIL